jgi:hypothetical protein
LCRNRCLIIGIIGIIGILIKQEGGRRVERAPTGRGAGWRDPVPDLLPIYRHRLLGSGNPERDLKGLRVYLTEGDMPPVKVRRHAGATAGPGRASPNASQMPKV